MTRRQLQILEFIRSFLEEKGFAPTLQEIADHFSLRSLATVHKHLDNLAGQGYLRRGTTSRSIELLIRPERQSGEVPLLARLSRASIRNVNPGLTVPAPPPMTRGRTSTFALQVLGDFLSGEGIRDGDYLICEDRQAADEGETAVMRTPKGHITYGRFRAADEYPVLGIVLGLIRYL